MGRSRAGKKSKKPVTDKQSVEFVEVSSREMVVWEADLTKQGKKLMAAKPPKLDDAVVKPVVRYKEGDEQCATEVAASMVKTAKTVAKHVYKPEMVVVRERRERMPELTPDMDPLDAAVMWMMKRPPTLADKDDVLELLGKYLANVPRGAFDRMSPTPFTVLEFAGRNYRPFKGVFRVESLKRGIYAIAGRYEGAEDRSNRAGKSDLASVVEEVLYADIFRGKDRDWLVHDGESEMEVGARFGNLEYKPIIEIHRDLKRGGGAKVDLNGDRYGAKAGAERIHEVLGLEREDFVRTCFVREDDLHGILGQPSGQIKADLMRWMGLSGWTHVAKAAGDELKKLEAEIAKLRSSAEIHYEQASVGVPSKKEIDAQRKRLVNLEGLSGKDNELELAILDLENRLERAEEIADALEIVKEEKIWRRKLKSASDRAEVCEEDVTGLREIYGVVMDKVRECKRVLGEGFDGECPVDTHKCPRKNEINENTRAMKVKIRKAEVARDAAKDALDGARNILADVTAGAECATRKLRMIADAQEVVDNADGKQEGVSELKRMLSRARRHSDDIEPADRSMDEARDRLTDMLAEVKARDAAAKKLTDIETSVGRVVPRLDLLRYVAFISGKRGIPSMQIENAACVIEGMANDVLSAMGAEHRLEFKFDAELKTVKEDSCGGCGRMFEGSEKKCPACSRERGKARADMFSPMVREGERVRSFEQDSRGGKSMLALAVRVALARFLGLAVLFLDEVCSSLDPVNLRAFVGMLPRLLETGFEQVFVISHRRVVAEMIPKVIEAVRYPAEQRSEVKWQG